MIQGIRTPLDYWAEMTASWPKDVNPDHFSCYRDAFLAGFAIASSFHGELRLSPLSKEEKVAIHSFCVTEAARMSGMSANVKLVTPDGSVEIWEL